MSVPRIAPELLALATPEEIAAYEQALQFEVALQSPADFGELVSDGKFQRPAHIELVSKLVADLVDGRLLKPSGEPYKRLVVSIPVRHGKSFLISQYTPAWFLSKYPERHIGLASYEADFAAEWGRKVRDIMEQAPAGLVPTIRRDTRAAARWLTDAGGGMFTAGVGGPLTGKGFHCLIVDDPIKNFAEASSDTVRQKVHDWFLSTALTRLEPGGVAVILMARWHEDDLAGRMLADEPDNWYHVSLPALAGQDDPLGRSPGQALWPERYDEKTLLGLKETMGPQIWASLYQQTPQIEGGGIFRTEKLRRFTQANTSDGTYLYLYGEEGAPKTLKRADLSTFGVVDLAASTRTSADFSVFALFGMTRERDLLLLDLVRERIEGADHMRRLEQLHERWNPRVWGIERATFGLTLLQTASRTGRIPVMELRPDWDKVARAYTAGAMLEGGRFYVPKTAPWLSDYVSELQAFPNGRHDDQVDATSYAALIVAQRLHAPKRVRPGEEDTLEARVWASALRKRKGNRHHPILGAM